MLDEAVDGQQHFAPDWLVRLRRILRESLGAATLAFTSPAQPQPSSARTIDTLEEGREDA